MRIFANKQVHMLKSVLFISFMIIITLGVIGGCSDGGGQNDSQALTEIDFVENSLRTDLEGVVVTFLEAPNTGVPENDTGEAGIDLIPITYDETTEQTFCWEDDNPAAMHFMELMDGQGDVILTVHANGDCVVEVIEEADYLMLIHHDGSVEGSLPIFLIPDAEDSDQVRKSDGLIDRFKLAASNILKRIDGTVTKDAQAQTVEENRNTLLSTNSCPGCNLQGALLFNADLTSANLSDANLSGAIMFNTVLIDADLSLARLFEAVLLDTDLTGANLVVANLSGADLTRADFIEANLSGANMSRSDFRGADLRDAILSRANMSRSDFRGADFGGAIMNGVDLNGADLSGAIWCDGMCVCTEGPFGACNGCAPVDVCTGP